MRPICCLLFVLSAGLVLAADDFKPEPGFTLIFNGKNLDGWQTKADGKTKAESLAGKTEAFAGRYRVEDGQLVIDYKTKQNRYIDTAKELTDNVVIRFDFKPGEGCNNDFLFLGSKFDVKAGAKGSGKGVKLDEWNTMEIVVKGGTADFMINGEKAATQKTKGAKGPLSVRAEFGPINLKNIRVSEGKK